MKVTVKEVRSDDIAAATRPKG